jgi:tetratricopeptide (TPR) repeat protein
MAHLAAAQWAYNGGLYLEAEREFQAALAEGPAAQAINPFVLYGRGHLAIAEGDLAKARECFDAAIQTPDVALSALARLRLAETLECLGEAEAAKGRFQALLDEHPDEYFGHIAKLALGRIGEHGFSELRKPVAERRALYLGEDRQTQGDWRIYGRDFFLLCGANGLVDPCGGVRWPFTVRAYLGSGGKIWWWSGGAETHPSMVYNPSQDRVGACNWDDGGEKQPVGTGPDMFLDLDIPPGRFRLSLYFVNDHSYFEPNREYTVYLLDREADGSVLAACPVRDFLQGVYEHFAVVGPRKITMRAFRNMSLNVIMSTVFLDEINALPEWESLAEAMGPNAVAAAQEATRALGLAAGEPAGLHDGLTVGAALARSRRAEAAIAELAPWARAAAAWGAFRECAESGCARWYHTAWLRRCYESAQAGAAPEPARDWLASVSKRLLESGYVGHAEILDGMVYPLDDPNQPYQSVTVPLTLADRYSEVIEYHEVPNRGMPPKIGVRKASLDRRLALRYLDETIRRFWAEQPERAKRLCLMLADKYNREKRWPWMAARCYQGAFAQEGKLEELTPQQQYDYAWSLPEGPERIPALEALLARGVPPTKECVIRGQLLVLYVKAGDKERAEAEARRILELDVPAGYKWYHILGLATRYEHDKEYAKAAEWSRIILERFPESPVAGLAQRILDEIRTQEKPKEGGK